MIELKITGMSCQHCVGSVRAALEGVAGVRDVETLDLDSGRALIEGRVDPELLVAAVKEAGYAAELVSA